MHHPRTAELYQWLADLDLDQQLVTMHALSFAFPILKNDRRWEADIAEVTGQLKPTPEQDTAIMVEAIRMSDRLKRELLAWRNSVSRSFGIAAASPMPVRARNTMAK